MSRLTARHITRGGRNPIQRTSATDPGYSGVHHDAITKMLAQAREEMEYDKPASWQPRPGEALEPWQERRKYAL